MLIHRFGTNFVKLSVKNFEAGGDNVKSSVRKIRTGTDIVDSSSHFFNDRCPAVHVARPKYALLQSYLAFFDLPYTVESPTQYIAGRRARTEVCYLYIPFLYVKIKVK